MSDMTATQAKASYTYDSLAQSLFDNLKYMEKNEGIYSSNYFKVGTIDGKMYLLKLEEHMVRGEGSAASKRVYRIKQSYDTSSKRKADEKYFYTEHLDRDELVRLLRDVIEGFAKEAEAKKLVFESPYLRTQGQRSLCPSIAGFYDNYEYEEGIPLAFISLFALTDKEKVQLLARFDRLYADTNQETTDWALEYQVLARMLLHEAWLPINLRHLNMKECLDGLLPILGPLNHSRLKMALDNVTQQDLKEAYQNSKG